MKKSSRKEAFGTLSSAATPSVDSAMPLYTWYCIGIEDAQTPDEDDSDLAAKTCWAYYHQVARRIERIRRDMFLWNALYLDSNRSHYVGSPSAFVVGSPTFNASRGPSSVKTFNLISEAVDTLASMTMSELPRVTIASTDALGSTQRRCRKLTQFNDGLLDGADVDTEMVRAGKDALVCGMGYLKFYTDAVGDVCSQHVFPSDILVDPDDARMKKPTQLAHIGKMPTHELIKSFPSKRDGILASSHVGFGATTTSDRSGENNNMSRAFVEAWHLPSFPGAKDGRHLLALSDVCLIDEPWDVHFFPVVTLRFEEDPLQWWGLGVAEKCMGLQARYDNCFHSWWKSYRQNGMPRFIAKGKVIESQVSTGDNILCLEQGSSLEALNVPFMSEDFYPTWGLFKTSSRERVGISDSAVNASHEQGVDSGVGMRELRDNQTTRQSHFSNELAKGMCRAAEIAIELTRLQAKKGLNPKVNGRRFMGSIDWKECDLPANKFTVTPFATNEIARDPAGRKQYATELAQAGILDKMTLLRIYDQPDVEAAERRALSWWERLDTVIEMAYDHQKVPAEFLPDEYLLPPEDPGQCQQVLSVLRCEYHVALNEKPNFDPKVLKQLDTFYRLCKDYLTTHAPPPPPVVPPAPMGQGAPAPQSPAIPFKGQ